MAHSTAQTDSAAHLVLSLSCPDRPGIVHAVTGTLARRGGNITESKQFGDSSTGLFFMRVQVLTTVPREELEKDLAELAGEYEMEWSLDEVGRAMRTLIMVSKEGHCLTDLLFRARSQGRPVDVVGVEGECDVDGVGSGLVGGAEVEALLLRGAFLSLPIATGDACAACAGERGLRVKMRVIAQSLSSHIGQKLC